MKPGESRHWASVLARDIEACPRPDKRAYSTKGRAKRALQTMRNADRVGLYAYRCTCGNFHLGHRRPT